MAASAQSQQQQQQQQQVPPDAPAGGVNNQMALEVERAAMALLRRRGYRVLSPEASELSDTNASFGSLNAARLQRAASSFGLLVAWAGGSVALVRTELLAALLPLLAHLFIFMVDVGKMEDAKELLSQHAGWFESPSWRPESQLLKLLEKLQRIRSRADLQSDEGYDRFRRQERTVVPISAFARDLLLSHLYSPEFVALAEFFQECVHLVDAPTQYAPGVLAESSLAEAIEANQMQLRCHVNVGNPPAAYGSAWQGKEGDCDPDAYSADNILEKCDLPLPQPNSRARVLASKHFVSNFSKREEVNSASLPCIAAYTVTGDGDGDVNCTALSNDGRFCAVGSRSVRFWDLKGEEKSKQSFLASELAPGRRMDRRYRTTSLLGHHGRVLSAAFSPDVELLVTGGQDGSARLWSMRHRQGLCVFARQEQPIWALDWCPTGHYFVTGGSCGEGLLWSVERSSPLRVFDSNAGRSLLASPDIEVVRTHPNNQHVAMGSDTGVLMWDLATASPVRVFPSVRGPTALAFSADGQTLAIGRDDGGLELWDIVAGKQRDEARKAHTGPVRVLDFAWPGAGATSLPHPRSAASDLLFFSGGDDGIVQLWSTNGSQLGLGGRSFQKPVLRVNAASDSCFQKTALPVNAPSDSPPGGGGDGSKAGAAAPEAKVDGAAAGAAPTVPGCSGAASDAVAPVAGGRFSLTNVLLVTTIAKGMPSIP